MQNIINSEVTSFKLQAFYILSAIFLCITTNNFEEVSAKHICMVVKIVWTFKSEIVAFSPNSRIVKFSRKSSMNSRFNQIRLKHVYPLLTNPVQPYRKRCFNVFCKVALVVSSTGAENERDSIRNPLSPNIPKKISEIPSSQRTAEMIYNIYILPTVSLVRHPKSARSEIGEWLAN